MSAVAELAAELVSIESINPALVPGAAGETDVAKRVAAWCAGAGLDVALSEPAPGRPNVVAIARGRGGGRTLLLNAHMDTVGVAGMAETGYPAERLHYHVGPVEATIPFSPFSCASSWPDACFHRFIHGNLYGRYVLHRFTDFPVVPGEETR